MVDESLINYGLSQPLNESPLAMQLPIYDHIVVGARGSA